MAAIPDLKIKGRLVFRPETGDTEHDLGEVEFALAPQPAAPVKRGRFASGGLIDGTVGRSPVFVDTRADTTGAAIPRTIVREMGGDLAYASRGFTVGVHNGTD